MTTKNLLNKSHTLFIEMDAVIELSNKAQEIINDDQQFLRQVSLLFNRIHVLEALKDDVETCALEMTMNAARETV